MDTLLNHWITTATLPFIATSSSFDAYVFEKLYNGWFRIRIITVRDSEYVLGVEMVVPGNESIWTIL